MSLQSTKSITQINDDSQFLVRQAQQDLIMSMAENIMISGAYRNVIDYSNCHYKLN